MRTRGRFRYGGGRGRFGVGGLGAAQAAPVDLTAGCLGYYTFDNVVTDSSPNARDLSVGTPTFTGTAKIGDASLREGPVSAAWAVPVTLTELTIAGWFYFLSSAVSADGYFEVTVSHGVGVQLYAQRNDTGSTARVRLRYDEVSQASSGSLSTSTFHHVLAAVTATSATFYVNGVLVSTVGGYGPFNAAVTEADADSFRVRVDECGAWDYAFGPDEVAALYNGGEGINPFA